VAHKTASGNQSNAWKDLENKVALLFKNAGFRGAKRVIKDSHVSLPDVDVPGIPELAIDTKYTNGSFAQHTQFIKEVDSYTGARNPHGSTYTWACMPIRPGGSKDILVVLRVEIFIEMLKRLFLRDTEEATAGRWLCPRCPHPVEKQSEWDGQNHYRCPNCHLVFTTSHVETPVKEEALRSQRDKPKTPKTLIKDHSKDAAKPDEFRPAPGQLTAGDLINRKKAKTTKSRKESA
jgi:uncharacterized C2H2 Zn-finger protein